MRASTSSLPASCCETVFTVSSAAARCCDSAKSRAFSIATVACSERSTRNSRSRSSNGTPAERHTQMTPRTTFPASSGATSNRSNSGVSVPSTWIARGSVAASLIRPGRPSRMNAPMMPSPASIVVAAINAASRPTLATARYRGPSSSDRKIALVSALSRSLACPAIRSITVCRSRVDDTSRPTSASAALSRVRLRISSKRFALCSATLSAPANVSRNRTSDSPKACSRS